MTGILIKRGSRGTKICRDGKQREEAKEKITISRKGDWPITVLRKNQHQHLDFTFPPPRNETISFYCLNHKFVVL
jgi:hypothetical protein